MWNLQDDNELDKQSREAADNYSLDRSPDSWSKLHHRLEAEMPTERRRRYLLFFLLFLFVGSGMFWLSRMNADDAGNPDIVMKGTTPKDELSNSIKADKSVNTNPNISNAGSADQKSVNATGSQPQSQDQVIVQQSTQSNTTESPLSPNQKPTIGKRKQGANGSLVTASVASKKGRNREKSDLTKESELSAGKEKLVNEKTISSPTDETIQPGDESIAAKNEDNDKKNVDTSPKEVKEQPGKEENATSSKSAGPKPRENSKWTFGAVYAPDISSVKFTHSQPIGFNVGVIAEYRLSKKFSLQSGLIYTQKNYKMYGDDYHPPKGSWFDYVHLEDVTGDCMMFDVPVNVRFNAVRKKSSNIFVSAGLSTYLMKEENYSYFYYYNSTPTTRDRSYDSNSEYLFSVLNISAGYEKKLSNTFSLQVEPFFKQPLTGLGFGEISLNSAGVYFSLRYNPLKPAKQQITAKK